MKKLINGIVEFRKNTQVEYRNQFGRLAVGQKPDTLFIACSDSRVVPNTFASTNPGDLFVVRNVGNLIPKCECDDRQFDEVSEGAAIEFAVGQLQISDIIVCGHSECGAMAALLEGRQRLSSTFIKAWLRHADPALVRLNAGVTLDAKLTRHNQLSQINTLAQLENLMSYKIVSDRVQAGSLKLHAWWFDLAQADVYAYEEADNRFHLIDEVEAERLLKR